MSRIQIQLYDEIFSHCETIGNCHQKLLDVWPECPFEWVRSTPGVYQMSFKVSVFTDNSLYLAHNAPGNSNPWYKKVALLIESPAVSKHLYTYDNAALFKPFDLVLTFSIPLENYLKSNGINVRHYDLGGSWLDFIPPEPTFEEYMTRNRIISCISSSKNFTYGHSLRHDLASSPIGDKIDWYGTIVCKPEVNRYQVLSDYRYSVVIENVKHDGYFTEKLIDCALCGTMPIYYGGRGKFSVRKYKNSSSVLFAFYGDFGFMDSIKQNYQTALQYRVPEKSIWKNGLEEMCKQ